MPIAYIRYINGKNGDVGPNEYAMPTGIWHIFDKLKGGYFSAAIEGVIPADFSRFIPLKSATKKEISERRIFVDLQNSPAGQFIAKENICLKQDDFDAFSKARFNITDMRSCDSPNCRIYTHFEGWHVEISAPRQIYQQSERVCDLMKNFLGNYTIKHNPIKNTLEK